MTYSEIFLIVLQVVGYTAATVVTLALLWGWFIAVMVLRDMYEAKTLTKPQFAGAAILLAVAFAVDWLINQTLFRLIYWERPENWKEKISERTKRHKDKDTRRGAMSRWLRKHFLGPFDKSGSHS